VKLNSKEEDGIEREGTCGGRGTVDKEGIDRDDEYKEDVDREEGRDWEDDWGNEEREEGRDWEDGRDFKEWEERSKLWGIVKEL
jgi:hypothetical protein